MTLTKERKAYVAILGVGLAGLIVDRIASSLGGGAPPADEYSVQRDEDAGEAVADSAESLQITKAENSFGHRLLAVAERRGIEPGRPRDAFAVPSGWEAAERDEARSAGESAGATPFAQKYRLGAVMSGEGGRGFVTLHGAGLEGGPRTLFVGQSIDGYRLVDVHGRGGRSAVFEGPGGRVRLTMDRSEGSGGASRFDAGAGGDKASGSEGG